MKRFDATGTDYLFVLLGDGRRWFIPARVVEAGTSIQLGGPKYSEHEIEGGRAIGGLVYGSETSSLESPTAPGEYRSGQTGCAVNALAQPSQVRILSPPSRPARAAQTRVWGKRRITIPLRAFDGAQLALGDRLRASADGPGRVILERIEPSPD